MASMLERLREAMNAHDAGRFAALFAEDYVSIQPVHPARAFVGRAQVLSNWTAVFLEIPDLDAALVRQAVNGPTEWGEWSWHGRHRDGNPFAMTGVIIVEVRDGLIAEGRLFMEPVDADAEDIEASVRRLYGHD